MPKEESFEVNGTVTQAKKFEQVTVLFTDFKGFTKQAEKLDPEEVNLSLPGSDQMGLSISKVKKPSWSVSVTRSS